MRCCLSPLPPPAAACRAAEAEQRAVAGHRRQGCSDTLVFDPDDGSTGSFEDFAKDRDAREKLVAASVRVFRTEAEATAYKQQEKKKRKQRAQQEEQQRKRKKAASGAP